MPKYFSVKVIIILLYFQVIDIAHVKDSEDELLISIFFEVESGELFEIAEVQVKKSFFVKISIQSPAPDIVLLWNVVHTSI